MIKPQARALLPRMHSARLARIPSVERIPDSFLATHPTPAGDYKAPSVSVKKLKINGTNIVDPLHHPLRALPGPRFITPSSIVGSIGLRFGGRAFERDPYLPSKLSLTAGCATEDSESSHDTSNL